MRAHFLLISSVLVVGLVAGSLWAAVPDTAPDYGIDPEIYWHNHPYNPDGPNFNNMNISSPASTVNLGSGGSIHSAAGSGNKKIVLSAGGTYGTFSLNDLNNVHIVCDNASSRAKILGGTTIAINPAHDGYENLRGDKTLDYGSYASALMGGNPTAISIFNERATNFYFKNIIIDAAGGAYSPTHHRARCVLYNNVRWQNFDDVEGDWHHRGTVYAAMGNFNIWFYNCQLYGTEEMITYFDGAVYCGWVNCYMADNHLRGGLLLLVNDDFSRDNNYDGLYEPEEQMAPKYPVVYNCTVDEETGIIMDFSNADRFLIMSNRFNGGSSGNTLIKNWDRCSQRYHGLVYNSSNGKIIGNRVATPTASIYQTKERKVTQTVGDTLYGINYARIGRYVIRDNVFETSTTIVDSEGDIIGPNYVFNNNNGSTTMPTPSNMQWPTISITSPANNSHWPTLTDIPINATYNDPDGSIVAVDLLIDDIFIYSDTTAPFNITFPYWKGLTGTHEVKVVAMDNHGNTTMEKRTIIIDSIADEVNVTFSSSSFDVKNASKVTPVHVNKTASVDKDGATAALLVVNPNDIDFPEEFDLKVNGTSIKDDCPLNIAHNGTAAYSSYVPIDLSLLNDGNNTLTWSYINNISGSTSGFSIDGSLILRVKYGGEPDTAAPSTPSGLTEASKTDHTATMYWTASTDNVAVAGYKIIRNGSEVDTSTSTNFTDTGLSPSTAYTYGIAAYDAAGNVSATSSTISITTADPDTQDPTTPTGLHVTQTNATSVILEWTASTDNLGVAGYIIYEGGVQHGTSDGTSYMAAALTPTTTYSFTVSAYDAATNESSQSSAAVVTTLDGSVSGLPAPWEHTDVGSIPEGDSDYSGGVFTGIGAGKIDSTATSDSFHFIYQPLNGDGEIIAHVTGIDSADAASRAGVMIRETLDANSKHAFVATENGTTRNSAWRYRPTTGGNNVSAVGAAGDQDRWVRLVRAGSTFTAYEKENEGDSWSQIGSSASITMANNAYVGLVFMANSLTAQGTATYASVSVVGGAQVVAEPVISPDGGTHGDSVEVTLTCATSGADIRYTTDGSDPTTGSTLYSSPFTLTADATVKARAYKDGMSASSIAQADFTVVFGGSSGSDIWMEAEDGTVSGDWTVRSDESDTSAGEYVSSAGNTGTQYTEGQTGAGKTVLNFTVTNAATYAIWCRVIVPSDSDDSFFVNLDSGGYTLWDCTEGSASWNWQKYTETSLSAASHTLEVQEREDGAKIDKVLITSDLAYTPTGQGYPIPESGDDSDGDGIKDSWETAHFGNLTTANGTSDNDGDGVLDIEEYIANTQPTNSLSILQIDTVDLDVSDNVLIKWTGRGTNRLYSILWSTNLTDAMQPLGGGSKWQPGGDDDIELIATDAVHSTAARIFYRLKVELDQ